MPNEAPKYPTSQKYSELCKTNPLYNRERMDEHEALFEGGIKFDEQLAKGKFLIKRESEKGPDKKPVVDVRYENPEQVAEARRDPNCGSTYELRKKYVSYKQRVGGLINWIIASVLSSQPVIVATRKDASKPSLWSNILNFFGRAPGDKADPKLDYYHALNANADGLGTSLIASKGRVMRDLAVHNRAFAGFSFPQTGAADAQAHRDAGGTNATLTYYPALEIDDWDTDADGLCMVRRHIVTETRSDPTKQNDQKTESWIYITPAGTYTYSIVWQRDEKTGVLQKPKPDDDVKQVDFQPNSLNKMPVHMVTLPIHIMERLRPSAIDQINLACDYRWGIQACVYAIPIFFTKEDFVINPDTMAIRLNVGDSAIVLSPAAAAVLAPIVTALERNDDEMYEALMAAALQAATQPSNGRQSSLAKRMDFESFITFLQIFSEPLRALLLWQVSSIQEVRGDKDLIVTVQGLDNFDLASVTQIVDDAIKLFGIQGLTPTMRKSIILRIYRAFMGSSLTAEQLEAAVKEISDMPDPEPMSETAPAPVSQAPATPPKGPPKP